MKDIKKTHTRFIKFDDKVEIWEKYEDEPFETI